MTVCALVIEDAHASRQHLARSLEGLGAQVLQAGSAEEAHPLIGPHVGLVFLSPALPGISGAELLRELTAQRPELPVVILGRAESPDQVQDWIRRGACDVLERAGGAGRLALIVARARRDIRLHAEILRLRRRHESVHGLRGVVGSSPPMRKVQEQIRQVARASLHVALVGEPGTGKEFLARALHHESPRHAAPFMTVHCGALPPPLVEAALFEPVDGGPGALLQAQGGTLFLEGIGALTPTAQTRLTAALETRRVPTRAEQADQRLDVRVITASGGDLRTLVLQGRLNAELYYQVVPFAIAVPALRERGNDLAELAYHFLHRHRAPEDRPDVLQIDDDALGALRGHAWPRNVRELEDAIRYALRATGPGPSLGAASLPEAVRGGRGGAAPPNGSTNGNGVGANGAGNGHALASALSPFRDPETGELLPLRAIEERAFKLALREHGGNTTRAARALGVARATFYRRLGPKKSA